MKKCLLSALSTLLIASASAQWQPQNAGFTNDTLGFYEMSLPNANTAWAICYDGKNGLASNRLILDFTRTINGGATWVAGKVGTDTTLGFSNISALSETEAWVAMHKRFGTGGGLYHTTDGGATWSQSGAGAIFDSASFPNVVHFRDVNHGVAMGDPNGGYFEIYTTDNGGAAWQRVTQLHMPTTLPNEYGWISGFNAVDSTIWFGTTSGRIWKSVNLGKDWTAHVCDPAGKFINEIAFNDDKLHGVAHLRNNQGTYLYATSDGGITWSSVGQPPYWKRSRITAVPGTDALVSTSVIGYDRGSAVSYDNGATWTNIDNTILMAVCRFYNATTGYAGSFFVTGPPYSPGIYKSTIAFRPLAVAQAAGVSQKDVITIYPLPANNAINISLGATGMKTTSRIYVLSMEGKVLESKSSIGAGLVRLNVADLAPGIYVVRVTCNDETVSQLITISR